MGRELDPRSGKLKEETEDSLKDKRMERGGVDGNVRYDQKPRVKTGPVNKEKAMEKRKKAFDYVKNFTKVLSMVRSIDVMPLNLKKDDMGDVIKDFYKSKAPQFKGKSKERDVKWQLLLNSQQNVVLKENQNMICMIRRQQSIKSKMLE